MGGCRKKLLIGLDCGFKASRLQRSLAPITEESQNFWTPPAVYKSSENGISSAHPPSVTSLHAGARSAALCRIGNTSLQLNRGRGTVLSWFIADTVAANFAMMACPPITVEPIRANTTGRLAHAHMKNGLRSFPRENVNKRKRF